MVEVVDYPICMGFFDDATQLDDEPTLRINKKIKPKSKTRDEKELPFIRKCQNANFDKLPFEEIKISTATMDVRLVEGCDIKFRELFQLLPVVPKEVQENCTGDEVWPIGTITGAACGKLQRGVIPTKKIDNDDPKKGFKNSTMVWLWLKDKRINVKISNSSLHMTGCKHIDNALEAVRHVQQHVQVINDLYPEKKIFEKYPTAVRVDVCMINYNFALGVALDLELFDVYIDKHYPDFGYSSYDINVCNDTLSLKVPKLSLCFTIHDNGRVSMCSNEQDIDAAMNNLQIGYETFYLILEEYRDFTNSGENI
jgi:hypothetical protein